MAGKQILTDEKMIVNIFRNMPVAVHARHVVQLPDSGAQCLDGDLVFNDAYCQMTGIGIWVSDDTDPNSWIQDPKGRDNAPIYFFGKFMDFFRGIKADNHEPVYQNEGKLFS